MPNRQQPQDQQQKGRRNPGTFSPDDDEAQEADRTGIDEQQAQGGQRQTQDDRRRPEQNIEQMDNSETGMEPADDEDESDDISQRP
jgi:hypothetical protein